MATRKKASTRKTPAAKKKASPDTPGKEKSGAERPAETANSAAQPGPAVTAEAAVELLEEIRTLLSLNGENPFKIRAFEKAQGVLAGRTDLHERARSGTLTEIEGIGKGISEVLTEYLLTGRSSARDELKAQLPEGLLELVRIPGLGPKKARVLIEELGVKSLGELEYACRENRLLKLKGFGDKAQAKILEGVQFLNASRGHMRLVDAIEPMESLLGGLRQALGSGCQVEPAGAARRSLEVVDALEFLVGVSGKGKEKEIARAAEDAVQAFRSRTDCAVPVRVHYAALERFGYELARLTSTAEHWKALGEPAPFDAPDEEAFYGKLGLPWIAPETRETGEEVELARAGKLDTLLPWDGVQGVFHNHTTRSDGSATLEEMVLQARKLGYRYIGISDHSQSAFYAQGLRPDDLKAQEKEIRDLQQKYDDIRIFWGIESDILKDGSLDYDDSVLKRFDFVIASIHSRFGSDVEAMTDRILMAIRNPYTRFVGHITGRLLLGRKGYDIHMEKLIREAAKHDVAIEINANPARLDIDWRWGRELRTAGARVSINPDAHDTAGLEDTRFGIGVARKALLPSSLVVNSRPVDEVEAWLRRK